MKLAKIQSGFPIKNENSIIKNNMISNSIDTIIYMKGFHFVM